MAEDSDKCAHCGARPADRVEARVDERAQAEAYTAMFGEEPPPSGHPSSGTEGGSA